MVHYRCQAGGSLKGSPFSRSMQDVLHILERECPDVLLLAYLDDVYLQGPATAVEAAFHRFSQLCKDNGLDMATEKCEVWSAGNPTGANDISKCLRMLFAMEGIVAAGCPIGSSDFVQFEANDAADKVLQLIKRVLALPSSAQDKLLLLCKSLQLKILHLSRVACKSDVVGAISKVEQEILAGILHILKCSDQCFP